MTAKEIQKRNKKAEQLRVIQVDPETYYVESSDGKGNSEKKQKGGTTQGNPGGS